MSTPLMSTPLPIRQGATAVVAAWVLWRILLRCTAKRPLDNIPGPEADSWISGSITKLFNPNAWDFYDELATKYGGVARVQSLFGDVMLHVHDPQALHHIIVKDQNIYEETDDWVRTNGLVFGKASLLTTLGDHHRRQRKLLNPVFSIAHMRGMVPIFYEVSYKLREAIHAQVSDGPKEIDMLSWMSRTALELIGQAGLGSSFDPLVEGSVETAYSTSIKQFMQVLTSFTFSRFVFLPLVENVGSARFRRFWVDLVPWKKLHTLRDMVDTMHHTSVDILESKKRALEREVTTAEETGQGKDIISILLKTNTSASEEDRLPEEEILAQMSTFTFAGMDTTSNALSRVLCLLGEHPDVQARLREEIREARKEHGDLQYDELVALPYLDAICRETLRLYPPLPFVMRQAKKDIILPLSKPFTSVDGKETHEILVPRNTQLLVSIAACNKNPALWGPDSYEWKPERWLSSLPDTVTNAPIPGVYSHLMTFLGGGRSCIGFKFSQLEMKVVLSTLIESFRFDLTDKKIAWQFIGISQPAVEELNQQGLKVPRLQLPLIVTLAT